MLSLPALECLLAAYTEVWVPTSVAPLIRFADRVESIAATGIDRMGLPGIDPPAALLERLRSFDSIVSWYGANRDDFQAQAHDLRLTFRFFDALPPAGERIHAADFFLRQVSCNSVAVPRIDCPR